MKEELWTAFGNRISLNQVFDGLGDIFESFARPANVFDALEVDVNKSGRIRLLELRRSAIITKVGDRV